MVTNLFDINDPAESNFEAIKYKLMSELSNYIAEYFYSQHYSQESKGEVIENIGKSVIDCFSNLFKDFRVHDFLKSLLMDTFFDIALTSDTWYKHSVNISFLGYTIIRRDWAGGRGVAIIIQKDYHSAVLILNISTIPE